jgi:hypothetical protein
MTPNRRNTQKSRRFLFSLSPREMDPFFSFLPPQLTGGLKTHFVFLAEKLNELLFYFYFMLF